MVYTKNSRLKVIKLKNFECARSLGLGTERNRDRRDEKDQ
jgi:hypothetical protein